MPGERRRQQCPPLPRSLPSGLGWQDLSTASPALALPFSGAFGHCCSLKRLVQPLPPVPTRTGTALPSAFPGAVRSLSPGLCPAPSRTPRRAHEDLELLPSALSHTQLPLSCSQHTQTSAVPAGGPGPGQTAVTAPTLPTPARCNEPTDGARGSTALHSSRGAEEASEGHGESRWVLVAARPSPRAPSPGPQPVRPGRAPPGSRSPAPAPPRREGLRWGCGRRPGPAPPRAH